MKHDPVYAERAAKIATRADVEVIAAEWEAQGKVKPATEKLRITHRALCSTE